MSKFDTHGGYFAPAGFMRINTGGKHEENPNGGVQVGMDEEGVPNLLEEGEPVYRDFVFSDNIKAKKDILDEYKIPTMYADKLYSEIADSFLEEAEQRPNDAISANGLNAMLGRLADAQEAQKEAEEEQALMEELKNMSPEELAELEAALAQEMQAEQQPEQQMPAGEVIAPEQIAPEQITMQPQEAMSMMACGGKMNKFEGGGRTGRQKPIGYYANKAATLLQMLSPIEQKEITMPDGNTVTVNYAIGNAALPENVAAQIARGERMIASAAGQADKGVARSMISNGKKLIRDAKKLSKVGPKAKEVVPVIEGAKKAKTPLIETKAWNMFPKLALGAGAAGAIGAGIYGIASGARQAKENKPLLVDIDDNDFAFGGRVRKFGDGSPGEEEAYVLPEVNVTASRPLYNPYIQIPDYSYDVWRRGRFLPDDWASYYGRIHAPLPGEFNLMFNDEPVAPINYPQPLPSMNANSPAAAQTAKAYVASSSGARSARTGIPRTYGVPNVSAPVNNWGLPGANNSDYFLTDADLDKILNTDARGNDMLPTLNGPIGVAETTVDSPLAKETENRLTNPQIDYDKANSILGQSEEQPYPTWPRYAGAIGSGLMALANLAQAPDRYEYTPVRPYLPYGHINLQDERYMPIDMNMVANSIQAQSQANARGLRNSGLGPSLASAQLAADYNATQNLGTGLLQGWQANNQERNRVISANNANEVQRANFYQTLEQMRMNALNQAKYQNMQNALYVQRLNNAAESEKYAAVSQNLDNALSALSDIGYENANRNMVRGAYPLYGLGRDFDLFYRGNYGKCGGMLKTPKKK